MQRAKAVAITVAAIIGNTKEMVGSLLEQAGACQGSLYPVRGAASSAGAGPTSGALA